MCGCSGVLAASNPANGKHSRERKRRIEARKPAAEAIQIRLPDLYRFSEWPGCPCVGLALPVWLPEPSRRCFPARSPCRLSSLQCPDLPLPLFAYVRRMFHDLLHFTQLTTQDAADVKTINFFVKFTNDWPDVETYSGSNNPGQVWVW